MTDLAQISDIQALTQKAYDLETSPTSGEVNDWITDASAFIEEATGRKYAETTVTAEYHDGNGTPFILLDHYPITTITSLTVDSALLVENTSFWIKDINAGVLECLSAPDQREAESAVGHRNILCAYKYGITTIPTMAKELCAVIVAIKALGAAANVGSSGGAIKNYSDGDITITYNESNAQIGALMTRYTELRAQLGMKLSVSVGALE